MALGETEKQQALGLVSRAQRMVAFRESPAYKEVMGYVEHEAGRLHRQWALTEDKEKREQLWQDARGFYKFEGLVNRLVNEGVLAQQLLADER